MITDIDKALFVFLNSLNTPFLDEVMSVISMKAVWIPLYMFIIWMLYRQQGKRIWIIILFAILLVAITDQVSVLMKSTVCRLRPCHEPSLAGIVHIVKGRCGGMYGFVSSHAANSFGIAAFTAPVLKKRWYTWMIFVWAAVVSYSRIYLGVHYPGDVAGGMVLGLLSGSLVAWVAIRTIKSQK